MRLTRIQLLSGSFVGLVGATVLGLSVSMWGQAAPSDETAALRPAVTVHRQGRLLVLDYQLLGADGQPHTQSVSRSRPEFTIHQGKRQVASGRFQYG
jgi:hypothetical protein